jgi:hypothetical protein
MYLYTYSKIHINISILFIPKGVVIIALHDGLIGDWTDDYPHGWGEHVWGMPVIGTSSVSKVMMKMMIMFTYAN